MNFSNLKRDPVVAFAVVALVALVLFANYWVVMELIISSKRSQWERDILTLFVLAQVGMVWAVAESMLHPRKG